MYKRVHIISQHPADRRTWCGIQAVAGESFKTIAEAEVANTRPVCKRCAAWVEKAEAYTGARRVTVAQVARQS